MKISERTVLLAAYLLISISPFYSQFNLSTPNVIANVRHILLHERAVQTMQKKFKLSSEGDDSGSRIFK
jgi:hypothetical protein